MEKFHPTTTTQHFQDTAEDVDDDFDFTFDDDDLFSMILIDENGPADGISTFFDDETDDQKAIEYKPHISPAITSQYDTSREWGLQEPSESQEVKNSVKHIVSSNKRPAFLSLMSTEELDEQQNVTSSRLSAYMERSEQSRRDLYRQIPDLLITASAESRHGNSSDDFFVHQQIEKSQQLASSYAKALRRMTWC